MIFAAGKGTRLKPLTDVIPKAMVPVGDVPLLQRVYLKLVEAGADRIMMNVHHHAQQLTNYAELLEAKHGVKIDISDESDNLLETGGGIKKAFLNDVRCTMYDVRCAVDENILIHNCDILSNVDLAKFYEEGKEADATLLVSERKTQRYLCFDDDMRLVGWTNIATGEVKGNVQMENGELKMENGCAPKLFAFSGIHIISPRLIERMKDYPDVFPIMDFYLKECATANIRGIVKTDLKLLDVGKLDTLEQAGEFLGELKK